MDAYLRRLLANARRDGWQHSAYPWGGRRGHCWTGPQWRVYVEIYVDGGFALLTVRARRRRLSVTWDTQIAEVSVTSPEQAVAVLAALGVLQVPEQVAA